MPGSPPTDKPSVEKSQDQGDCQSAGERLTAKIAVVSAPPAHLADFRFACDVAALHRLGSRALAELVAELGCEHLTRSPNEARVRRYVERDILRAFDGDRFPPGPMRMVGRAQGDLDAAP